MARVDLDVLARSGLVCKVLSVLRYAFGGHVERN